MVDPLTIEATQREEFGKNAARRLRAAGRIPAVVYGGDAPPVALSLEPRKLAPLLHSEASRNTVFTLVIGGKAPARVMLRDWQVEPVHGALLHVDLVRVTKDTKVRVRVPIHVTGEAKGVKVQGGIFEFVLREVEVECLPEAIPESVTIDVTDLVIGRTLRVSDLPLSPEVKLLTDPSRVVAHVVALKAEEKPAAEAEVAEAAPTEPEVIRKGKTEESAEEADKSEKKEAKKGSEK